MQPYLSQFLDLMLIQTDILFSICAILTLFQTLCFWFYANFGENLGCFFPLVHKLGFILFLAGFCWPGCQHSNISRPVSLRHLCTERNICQLSEVALCWLHTHGASWWVSIIQGNIISFTNRAFFKGDSLLAHCALGRDWYNFSLATIPSPFHGLFILRRAWSTSPKPCWLGTQQNSYSISHLLGTVTTEQWLHRTRTLLGIHYHGAYVEICLLSTW